MQGLPFRRSLLTLVIFGIAAMAQGQTYKFSTLYSFKNNGKDPAYPTFLIMDSAGNLYGTSGGGGTHHAGTVFKVTPNGVLTVLHSFNGTNDGSQPNSLTRDPRQGDLYGTTTWTNIFKLAAGKDGTYTFSTLYRNSAASFGAAMVDSVGNLYGTNQTCSSALSPCVWEIPAGKRWRDIWDLGKDYDEPFNLFGNIIEDKMGNLYVSAAFTGIGGEGWVQEIGGEFRTFGPADFPVSLRQNASGDIYGLSQGYSPSYGSLFKESVNGVLSIIYSFTDGSEPSGSFSLDSAGNIFGTTAPGGTHDFGYVFKVSPSGEESTIYNFSSDTNYGLVMDASGNIYGTSTYGGTHGVGFVYKLTKQ